MAMKAEEIQILRRLMEYEASRNSPPDGFPKLPDLPGGRYTDPRKDIGKQRVHESCKAQIATLCDDFTM